jgi:hypothetical protein
MGQGKSICGIKNYSGKGGTMTKPLHEMELSEVLDILTPTQRQTLLAYARQLARSTLSPKPSWFIDGRVQKPKNEALPPVNFKGTVVAADSKKGKKKMPIRKKKTNANLKTPRIVQGGLCSRR